MLRLSSIAVLLLLSGCRFHVMNAELVSMTTKEMPENLKKGKSISEEWCLNDKPIRPEPDKHYGLIDQVVLKAQKKYDAKYFADASFYREGSCMTMTGYVVK